jgi:tRNA U34 5-carboxymethylaminomethyl modifying enzyme MnmG/GidA
MWAKLDATANHPLENSRLHLTCTTINTTCKTMHRVMAAKVIGLTQKSAILWQMIAGSCTTYCPLSYQKVWELLDTPLLNHNLIEAVHLSVWVK